MYRAAAGFSFSRPTLCYGSITGDTLQLDSPEITRCVATRPTWALHTTPWFTRRCFGAFVQTNSSYNGEMSIPRVFWSVTPGQTQSPYISDIVDAIETQGWTVESMTLRDLARTSKQIVHIQWPEHVSRGPSTATTVAKHLRAVGLVAALRIRKHAVVITAHNRAPHGDSDAVDAWFRRSIQRHAAAMVLLVPGHKDDLTMDNAIGPHTMVRTIPHPTHPPSTQLVLNPERHQLVVLGQIHPYHRIAEFVSVLEAHNNSRPVLIVGGVGDSELLAELTATAKRLPWLSIQPGFASNETLEPILADAAAIVSLQRNTFNSGGPFYSLPRNLPIIMSSGAQATSLRDEAGDDWVFAVPDAVENLDVPALETWIQQDRTEPMLDSFDVEGIAASHIELYELLQS